MKGKQIKKLISTHWRNFLRFTSSVLKRFGIENADDYREGNWFGNTSLDGMSIFNAVTHDFDDLVKSIVIQNQHEDDLKTKQLNISELSEANNMVIAMK